MVRRQLISRCFSSLPSPFSFTFRHTTRCFDLASFSFLRHWLLFHAGFQAAVARFQFCFFFAVFTPVFGCRLLFLYLLYFFSGFHFLMPMLDVHAFRCFAAFASFHCLLSAIFTCQVAGFRLAIFILPLAITFSFLRFQLLDIASASCIKGWAADWATPIFFAITYAAISSPLQAVSAVSSDCWPPLRLRLPDVFIFADVSSATRLPVFFIAARGCRRFSPHFRRRQADCLADFHFLHSSVAVFITVSILQPQPYCRSIFRRYAFATRLAYYEYVLSFRWLLRLLSAAAISILEPIIDYASFRFSFHEAATWLCQRMSRRGPPVAATRPPAGRHTTTFSPRATGRAAATQPPRHAAAAIRHCFSSLILIFSLDIFAFSFDIFCCQYCRFLHFSGFPPRRWFSFWLPILATVTPFLRCHFFTTASPAVCHCFFVFFHAVYFALLAACYYDFLRFAFLSLRWLAAFSLRPYWLLS